MMFSDHSNFYRLLILKYIITNLVWIHAFCIFDKTGSKSLPLIQTIVDISLAAVINANNEIKKKKQKMS